MSEHNDDDTFIDMDEIEGKDEEQEESTEEQDEEETTEAEEPATGDTPEEEPQPDIVLPSVTTDKIDELREEITNIMDTESESRLKWAEALTESNKGYLEGAFLDDAANRDGSDWDTQPEYKGRELSAFEPQIRDVTGKKLSGSQAVSVLRAKLGLGTKYSVPLWHSGFWVVQDTPTESDLLNLQVIMADEKIEFGNRTSGTVFSNIGTVAHGRLAEFIASHVYATSCKQITGENLLEFVKLQDFYTLIWGMVCACYPNGFTYSRPCLNDVAECDYVASGLVEPRRLLYVDKSRLTDDQLRHMSNRRPNSMNIEQIKHYQNTLSENQPDIVTLETSNGVKVTFELSQPSLADHITAGLTWVESVLELLEGVISKEEDPDARRIVLNKHARLTRLREFAHYVSSIEFDDNRIEDRATIDSALDNMSSDEKLTKNILKELNGYINNSTMSIVGIPEYTCPVCGENQNTEPDNRHPGIIPLDALYYFFILIRHKVT